MNSNERERPYEPMLEFVLYGTTNQLVSLWPGSFEHLTTEENGIRGIEFQRYSTTQETLMRLEDQPVELYEYDMEYRNGH